MDKQQAGELIDEILERYHEPHRQQLPALITQAHEHGLTAIARRAEALGEVLELHMFKEEMRLFPMISSGGDAGLLPHVIQDMMQEHERIDELAGALRTAIDAPQPAAAAVGEAGQQLLAAYRHFLDELAQHARREDQELFSPFL